MARTVSIRRAELQDIEPIRGLVEAGYRGEHSPPGWTSEAHLVGGPRTSLYELAAAITSSDGGMLVAEADGVPVGCCQVQRQADGRAYFGLFAVRPDFQAGGVGTRLLAAAEDLARTWNCRAMTMLVLSVRSELLAYYIRRGYTDIGQRVPFPPPEGRRVPKQQGLSFLVLVKDLSRP